MIFRRSLSYLTAIMFLVDEDEYNFINEIEYDFFF